jgi:hypothetical protein
MQTFPTPQSVQNVRQPEENHESRRAADRVYQGVTIAVMLLLLVSLWVF